MISEHDIWSEVAPEDRGFLADWYQTLDGVGRRAEARAAGDQPPVVQEAERLAENATYLDRLRHYLLDSAGLDGIPDPRPLIDGVLYLDTLAWLIGRPGAAKTLVGLDWAGHIGCGFTWNGFQVTPGTVIYVSPEAPSGIKLRVRAWEAANGSTMRNVYFLPVAVQAAVPGHWQALEELCVEKRPSLVVLDTQARVTIGLEENSAKDMGMFVDRLEHLRAATKACVLTVHHTPRGGDHMRGSTAMEGAASTIIKSVKDGNAITLTADPDEGGKTKDVAPFPPVALRLVPYENSVIISATGSSTSVDEISGTARGVLMRWWQECGSEPMSLTKIDRLGYFSERQFYRIKKVLLARGLITEERVGRSNLYGLVREPD